MTAPIYRAMPAHAPSVAVAFRDLDAELAEHVTVRAAFTAAIGFYDCPCGGMYEFAEDAGVEEFASLNQWLGYHSRCKLDGSVQ